MLLTITNESSTPDDLGFLLHKHPAKAQEFTSSVGTAHVFYPETTGERCTAALLLDVDPVDLVQGKRFRGTSMADTQYATHRPYASSSMLAVAVGRVFRSALAGTCSAKPDLVDAALPLTVTIAAVPCHTDDDVRSLFEPLGWRVDCERGPLNSQFPHWGDAPYANVTLTGTHTLQAALQHLYVLLPVLDGGKHYWVSDDEVDKLVRAAGDWLPDHPERERILRVSLVRQKSLMRDARAALLPDDETDQSAAVSPDVERRTTLRVARLAAVVQALADVGATSVVDVGCGEGQLISEMMEHSTFQRILGVDVAAVELSRAEKRLRLADLPETARERVRLRQSSLTYLDDELQGFDAAVLMEVIEHIDESRLPAAVAAVFGHAKPRGVVVTTPNSEYNVLYDGLAAGEMRHPDHRFEWDRATFRTWAEDVAAGHGYSVEYRDVGDTHETYGPSTQMAVFTR